MKKKLLAVLLSLAMVVSLLPTLAFATGANVTMTVTPPAGRTMSNLQVGDTVTVEVSNNAMTVSTFTFNVAFDKTKFECASIAGTDSEYPEYVSITKSSGPPSARTAYATTQSTTAEANSTGSVGFGWAAAADADYNAGAIVTITFTVTAVGSATFTLNEDSSGTAGFKDVAGTVAATIVKTPLTAASVTIPAPTKGNAFPASATAGDTTYTAESIAWFTDVACTAAAPATAAASTDYWAKVILAPDSANSESFADSVSVTVNGGTATSLSPNSAGKLEVVEKFTTPAKSLTGITIDTQPTNKNYVYGDTFNTAGMVVTAAYDDSSTAPVTAYTCDPSGGLKLTDTTITVSYTEAGVTKTATVTGITVTAKPLSDSSITVDPIAAVTYDGTAKTPDVVVKDGSTTLVKDTDYTVTYGSNTNAGTATVTLDGKGNYSGQKTGTAFTINKKPIDVSAYSWSYSAPLTYNDAAQTVTVTKSGTDSDKVTITYTNDATNSNSQQYVGSYVAKAEPTVSDSNYVIAGSIDNLSWSIVAADQSATLVDPTSFNVVRNHTSDLSSKVTGNKGALSFTITSGDAGTISGSTFTADSTKTGNVVISVKALAKDEGGSSAPEYNEQTVGTLTITVIAKPELAGQTHWTTTPAGWTYGDTPASLNSSCDKSPVTGPTYEYRGTGSTTYGPTSTVPTEVGTYTVTAIYEDDDNLYPSDAAAFSITAKDVSGLTVDPIDDQEYTGAAIFPTLTVKDGTKVLEEGTDYTVAYNDTNTNVGTAAGDITGIGNYSGTKTGAVSFNITKKSLALPTVGTNTFTYNGSEQTYTPDGFNANTMTISGNKQTKADTYSATISLKDTANYQWVGGASDPTLSFTIAPKALTLSATVADKTYDGAKTVDPATATVTLVGVVGSDKVVAPAVKSVSDTSSADAGTYPVTVTLANTTLTGADAGNYTLSASTVSANVTVKALSSGDAPVAEGSGTVAATPTDLTSSSKNTYDLTVKPSGSDTVKVVFAMPAGTNASYTFTLKFNGQTYTCKPGEAMNAGLVFELPAGSGVAELTWSAPTGSSSGGMMVINGNGTGTPVNGAATTGSMTVPTSLTGKISKVTVDGKAVSSKNYSVSGSNVTLSEAFMKTLSNGKHTVKVSDGTNTYTVTINVNRVSSAGTGDMGIALYAVLALSSATGAVWVSRKKREN